MLYKHASLTGIVFLHMQYDLFCQIQCFDVLLEDADIVKAITEYVSFAAIEDLVLGAPSRHGFIRYRNIDLYISASNVITAYVALDAREILLGQGK